MSRSSTPDDLLNEMRFQEHTYLLEKALPRNRSGATTARASNTRSSAAPASSSNTASSSRSTEQRESRPTCTPENYIKSNAWTDADGNRRYRVPGTKVVLNLGKRRCTICKQNHFDFEHPSLVTKKEALMIDGYHAEMIEDLQLGGDDGTFEGYHCSSIDGPMQVDSPSPAHSPTLTASSSGNSSMRLSSTSSGSTPSSPNSSRSGKGHPASA